MPERVEIKWNDAGIVPVIIQHDESGEVLMLNWMNAEALRLTQETGRTHFWDSAQRSVWQPDGEKGAVQFVEAIWVDCDSDTLLLTARPDGPACPDGQESCFYTELPGVLHPYSEDDLPWEG